MTTGAKIKDARIKKGLTQKQLGDILGVSQQLIGQYEAGKLNPKIETLSKIANALEVNPLELSGADKFFENIQSFVSNAKSEEELDFAETMLNTLESAMKTRFSLETRLQASYELLNESGKKRAVEYVEDLTKIEEYVDHAEMDKYSRM